MKIEGEVLAVASHALQLISFFVARTADYLDYLIENKIRNNIKTCIIVLVRLLNEKNVTLTLSNRKILPFQETVFSNISCD